jgi:hypothetical protein
VRAYAEKHPTIIKPILSDQNLYSCGLNPYYAFVFPAAKGKFIAMCDGDDYWVDPMKLEKQVSYLNEKPEVSLVYGMIVREIDGEMENDTRHGVQVNLSSDQLRLCPGINTLTACFRNFNLQKPPEFIRNSPMGDITLWTLVANQGEGHFLGDILPCVYRVTNKGIWSKKDDSERFFMHLISYACVAGHHGSQRQVVAEKAMLLKILRAVALKLGPTAAISDLVKRTGSILIKRLLH